MEEKNPIQQDHMASESVSLPDHELSEVVSLPLHMASEPVSLPDHEPSESVSLPLHMASEVVTPQDIVVSGRSEHKKYEMVKASEYYAAIYGKEKLSKQCFYEDYIQKGKIPYVFITQKERGGKKVNEYKILVDNPEILSTIRLKRKIKAAIKSFTKSFYVTIPENLDLLIKNTIASPLAFFYQEFFAFLESNKEKVKEEVGKYTRRRVKVSEDHYKILSNYAKELNIKLTDLVPVLVKLFIEHKHQNKGG